MDKENHKEGVFRDIVVRGEPQAISEFWHRLSVLPPTDDWRRRSEAEERYQKLVNRRTLAFEFIGMDLPRSTAWVLERPDELYVPNIVPLDTRELGYGEYNLLAESFARDVLGRCSDASSSKVRIELGADVRFLEDFTTPRVAEALRFFSSLANKGTGNTHPDDNERWKNFVLLAHEDQVHLSSEFLAQWLCREGWNDSLAARLAGMYEAQREILVPLRLDSDDSNGSWRTAVDRLRGFPVILAVDTSAVLDLMQLPIRAKEENFVRDTMTAVKDLVRAAQEPATRLGLLLISTVNEELKKQLPKKKDELWAALEDARCKLFMGQICAESLAEGQRGSDNSRLLPGAADALLGLIDEFCRTALPLPLTAEIHDRAYSRSIGGRAPAQRGKDSVADCGIAESLLALARHLPEERQSIIFLTSNKSDFGQAPLSEEFREARIIYCTQWPHARHEALGG